MKAPLAWITGAGGLVGNSLLRTAPRYAAERSVAGLTRALLDLADFPAVGRMFEKQRPQLVIHCAALSRSPACQENPALARTLNVEVTARLADLAADIPFIFFSSDLVFDGHRGNYSEDDLPYPLGVYAETKLAAEQAVLAHPGHTVVRVSLTGGVSPTGDRGFNEALCRAWRDGQTVKLFTDEFRSPIPALVTARAVWELAAQNRPGLYHLGGADRLSRWEIGQLLAARRPELNPRIEPAARKDYPGPARPGDTSLTCARIQSLLSFPLPGLREWLAANPTEPF